jgi:UDP-N-acetylglucosamine acyltransferase
MTTKIAPTAHVDPRAELAEDVEVGPFTYIGPDVVIGRGNRIENNVTIKGHTTLGEFNHIHPGTVIGGEPQDLSYGGADTEVRIGNHNVLRESVTINRGTEKDRRITTIGDRCYFMACSHVAHDCHVGSHVIIANGTMLGGHVHVHDHASISGAVAVHHFATVGSYSFVSGVSRVLHDVPPYMLVEGVPTRPRCVNVVLLKRRNFEADTIRALSESHRLLYRAKVGLDNAREILRSKGMLTPAVNHLLTFVQGQQEGRHGRTRDVRRVAA